MSKSDTELLKLFNSRWRDEIGKIADGSYKRPQFNDAAIARNRQAAQAAARVDNSDPFAGARMALYLAQGYVYASDELKDAHAKEIARSKQAKSGAVSEALAPVKRKIDADRAWNQHRASQYLEEKAV